jgi:uncharacterized membrane protein YtjA (UPF0391 family)
LLCASAEDSFAPLTRLTCLVEMGTRWSVLKQRAMFSEQVRPKWRGDVLLARRLRHFSIRIVDGNFVVVTCNQPSFQPSELIMLSWALTFLVIALIAFALGFGVLAGTAMTIAKILFAVFLVLFVISLVAPRLRPPA